MLSGEWRPLPAVLLCLLLGYGFPWLTSSRCENVKLNISDPSWNQKELGSSSESLPLPQHCVMLFCDVCSGWLI